MVRSTLLAAFVILAVTGARPARGCPDCVVAREARAQVYGEDFVHRLALAALPFLLVGAIALRADAIGRREER
jgi:hypothetical protein